MELPNKPGIFLYIGKPESGKSYLIKNMMYDFQKAKHFKFILCYVKTKFNNFFQEFLPEEYVVDNYSSKKLLEHVAKLKKYRETTGKPCPPSAIIFDDLLGKLDFYDDDMQSFLCAYRHYNVSLFITAQYLMSKTTATALREMVSYAFLFNTKFKNSLKGYYESFGGLFDNYDDFVRHFQKITKQKYHCMVYKADEDEIENNYVDYKAAESIPKFKLKYKF
jgi:hypothetical protein